MYSSNPELILIVDDTPVNLEVISDALINAKFEVAIALSAERMFKLLQRQSPDLILLDVEMPTMDGFETCQKLKAMESCKEIPIIFMTGLSDTESKTRGLELGAVDYITKPFQEAEVLARIKNHLQLRRLTKNLEQQVYQRTIELEKANQQLAEYSYTLEQTVQRRTQQLRRNEQQLLFFVEHTPVGVAMLDRQMRYLVASKRWLSDYQLESLPISSSHYDVFPNISPHWRDAYQAGLAGSVTRNEKDLYVRPDGTQEWLRWEVRPWYDETDSIGGIIIFGEIITDRVCTEIALQELNQSLETKVKQRTEKLQASEEHNRALISAIPDLLLRVRRDGTYMPMFSAVQSDAEPTDHPLYKNLPLELQQNKLNAIEKAIATNRLQVYEQQFINNGRQYYEEVRITPISQEYVLLMVRDISDRKIVEQKLKSESLRLQVALEAAEMGTWESNLDKGYWSERTEEIFGFAPGQFPGDREAFLKLVYIEDQERVFQTLHHSFTTHSPYKIEYRINYLNREIRWIAVSGKVVETEDGEGFRIIGVAMDITDRKQSDLERETLLQNLSWVNSELKQANQQLAEYSQTLENRVEERTVALKSAQERIIAQEKLASLGTLTAGVAHELRNPLNFVKNYAEGSIELAQDLLDALQPMMQSDAPPSQVIKALIDDLQENASTICRHSQRAEEIITSMMQHTRTDIDNHCTQFTKINELLNEAINLSFHSKFASGDDFLVTLKTNYSPDVDIVEVIPTNLIRAFINLVDNACDAIRLKLLELTRNNLRIDSEYKPTLTVSTRMVSDRVEIRIHDNGYGIAPEILSKVLDPFFTTKPPGAGTGLGLSLTHDIIVKQHQGSLDIVSNLGEFTEVTITLPQ
ncbi:response regulator [Pseudanabaena sp. 'Roaring Creek']|uniref:response regulator n=1 Tax=Pseudanabaena sp. 'Roaring Creek' TaxID=1681830 RepID=UPI0006D7C61F|nr:response regulator [Pseudanabaena sp. 'Roaring Creek']